MLDIEQFAISFQKLVEIVERVDIEKEVDVDVFVKGNLAMADTKAIADAQADALGRDTLTETLTTATTSSETAVVQGVGSSSLGHADSISQSLSAAPHLW